MKLSAGVNKGRVMLPLPQQASELGIQLPGVQNGIHAQQE